MFKQSDYQEIIDENGSILYVNNCTGETFETTEVRLPVGSKITMPDHRRFLYEKKKLDEMLPSSKHFFFLNLCNCFDNISDASVFRLIFLACFLEFNSPYIKVTERTRITKDMLTDIMNLSDSTVYRFLNECDNFLKSNGSNEVRFFEDSFYRGKLKSNTHQSYRKICSECVRYLYGDLKLSKHGYVGKLIKLIPFINFYYNEICWNPDEKIKNKIIPFTEEEFCDAIGYDYSQISRLKKEYEGIIVTDGKNAEPICSFKDAITVSPILVMTPFMTMMKNSENAENTGLFN